MRRILRLLMTIIIVSGLLTSVQAEKYTLERCIETALQNNYGVIAAKNSYDATKWSLYSAYSQLLPSLSISATRSESWSPAYLYIEGVRTPNPRPGTNINYSGSLRFGQSYPGLGLGAYANIKQKQAQRHSNYYNFVGAQKELVLSIKDAYFNVIRAKMLIGVSKDAVKRGEEQLKTAQSRYELGSASLSDVLKAKVLRSNAKLDMISAENGYNLAKADLNYRMGIDVAENIEIEEDLLERAFDIDYEKALSEALYNNPSYRKANYDLSKAKSDLLTAKAQFLPNISFGVTHGTTVLDRANLLEFNEEFANRSFYVQLSYNIFANFFDFSNVIASKKYVNSQKENLVNTKNAVSLEVRQAFLDIQQNREKLLLNEESVAAAQEDLNIVKEKYNLGAATIIEVLDAEVSFKQAQVNQVQALFDYNLAVSRLEKVMGR